MHPNEELARREIELINAGNDEAVVALYADDFVLYYPGRNPLAGVHHDLDTFFARFEALLDGGTLHRDLHDALGTDDHAVQLLEVTAKAKGMSHTWKAVVVCHVREGKFSDAWIHVDDQYALDDFLNSLER